MTTYRPNVLSIWFYFWCRLLFDVLSAWYSDIRTTIYNEMKIAKYNESIWMVHTPTEYFITFCLKFVFRCLLCCCYCCWNRSSESNSIGMQTLICRMLWWFAVLQSWIENEWHASHKCIKFAFLIAIRLHALCVYFYLCRSGAASQVANTKWMNWVCFTWRRITMHEDILQYVKTQTLRLGLFRWRKWKWINNQFLHWSENVFFPIFTWFSQILINRGIIKNIFCYKQCNELYSWNTNVAKKKKTKEEELDKQSVLNDM